MPLPFRAAIIALVLCVARLAGTELASPPADAALSPRGRAILAYFQALDASPDFKVLSGQFCNYGPDVRIAEAGKIFAATGKWPALVSIDYTDFAAKWVDTRHPNQLLIEYWRAGGLVAASCHLNNPARAEGGGLNDKGLAIADLLVAGTPVHENWLRQLDALAAGLQELQAAGVVVLWRPFHEMNGGWFWWGAQEPADFIRVWQHMFDYFTRTKGLHNLIWVYGPNHGSRIADYYPGDNYADLVGLDAYTDHIDPDHIKGYPELTALKKPFGFTEYGPHGASNPPGDYDFRRFASGLAANFPRTRFFLSWDVKWNPAANQFAREFYTDARVITRADLPPGLAGDEPTALAAWRAARVARLTAPDSWLSLIGRHALQAGDNTLGTAADNTIRLAAGPAHLGRITISDGRASFSAAPGAEITTKGQPVTTLDLVVGGEAPTVLTAGTVSLHLIDRGGTLYARVKDSASERLRNFAGIDAFPDDASWRIEADWVPFTPARQIPITNVLGQTSPAPVPGKAVFTRDGRTFELLPIDEGDGELFFIFSDSTAGKETYEAARFLYAAAPVQGKVILDFNRATNPPCAFTPFATCPLPPKENVLPIAVTAGEKKYRGTVE